MSDSSLTWSWKNSTVTGDVELSVHDNDDDDDDDKLGHTKPDAGGGVQMQQCPLRSSYI